MRRNDKKRIVDNIRKAERLRLQKRMAAFKHDAQWKVWVLTEDLEPGSSADAKPGKRNIDGSYTGIGTMTQKVHDFGLFAGADPDAVDPKIESGTAIICMFDQGSWLGLIVKECPAQEEE